MTCELLPWETELLGGKAGRLPASVPADAFCPGDFAFVSTKVAGGDEQRLTELVRRGFRLVETAVVLRHRGALPEPPCAGPLAIAVAPDDGEGIEQAAAIAFETFSHSRFHRDPSIPGEVARRSRREWVWNAHHRGRGTVLLARDGPAVVGFLVQKRSDGGAILDLVGVRPDRKRTGVGAALVAAHLRDGPAAFHQVTTQLTNRESLGLYRKLGYHFHDAYYSLHWHRRA